MKVASSTIALFLALTSVVPGHAKETASETSSRNLQGHLAASSVKGGRGRNSHPQHNHNKNQHPQDEWIVESATELEPEPQEWQEEQPQGLRGNNYNYYEPETIEAADNKNQYPQDEWIVESATELEPEPQEWQEEQPQALRGNNYNYYDPETIETVALGPQEVYYEPAAAGGSGCGEAADVTVTVESKENQSEMGYQIIKVDPTEKLRVLLRKAVMNQLVEDSQAGFEGGVSYVSEDYAVYLPCDCYVIIFTDPNKKGFKNGSASVKVNGESVFEINGNELRCYEDVFCSDSASTLIGPLEEALGTFDSEYEWVATEGCASVIKTIPKLLEVIPF